MNTHCVRRTRRLQRHEGIRRISSLVVNSIYAVSLAVISVACQTGELYLSRPLRVVVLDAHTRTPLKNVQVSVRSVEDPNAKQSGATDSRGYLELPALKGRTTIALPFVGDRLLTPAQVQFHAAQYSSKEISFADAALNGSDVSEIELEPVGVKPK